ncbi:beta-fructofuranosidase, insoluble isoenzyme 1-like isoform X1 [Chenopodium quinoa]|uniref:beta-fructofuranosidase, insoluble isoenzyme 1-like isoform X1 n=1 Tax=Chenopodium quinoa TaxID=63459 RepID=UPI000B78ACE0|nr:beta-fructofuranosidase, insoluble isoenzyme 1-like isoform X1 [Chenopodium quinoa]
MYYKGLYHLFYQYNPWGSTWGNIVWAHSVSGDLINWEALEPAIHESKPFDINGVWSGSATILPGNRPVILYTGLTATSVQVQNVAIPANLSDPYLRKWVKPDYNPIITPTSDVNTSLFRDPTTAWWSQGHWHIVVGSRRKHRGVAYLYKSRDFKKWTKAKHPLHSAPNTGMWECPDFFPVSTRSKNGLDTSTTGSNVKHVLKVSLDVTRFEYYTIGKYDANKDQYYPDNAKIDGWNGLRFDYGNFYASKTFFDSQKGRRILWGWSNESWTPDITALKGWAGIQAIPRSIWLDPKGKQLVQWPVEEVERLRANKVELNNRQLKPGNRFEIKGITPVQADVEVIFKIPNLEKADTFDSNWVDPQDLCIQIGSNVRGGVGPFGLLTLASDNLEEYTPIFFRVFKAQNNKHVVLMCSEGSSSSTEKGLYKPTFGGFVDVDLRFEKKISLRTLVSIIPYFHIKMVYIYSLFNFQLNYLIQFVQIDHSIVESFGAGGKTCIVSRVYPNLAIMNKAHLYVFNNGTNAVIVEHLKAWTMKKPFKMND